MKIALIVLGVLLLGGLIVFGGLMSSKNQLVTEREAINGAWAQVDAALQRRADLIPNLVETVKGFATHEEKVISDVTTARAADDGRSERRRTRSGEFPTRFGVEPADGGSGKLSQHQGQREFRAPSG